MEKRLFFIGICLIASCLTFMSNGKTTYWLLTEGFNIKDLKAQEVIDDNQTYLDSLVWAQMMEEVERISPASAKSIYSNKGKGTGKDNINSGGNTGKKEQNSSLKSTADTQIVSAMSTVPNQSEYDALMDFYQAMDGPNWSNNSGWSSANPNVPQSVSNFHGVTLDENGHVKFLILYNNNLNGTIPESFGNLTYLEHIQLVWNPFIGQLPQSIGNLVNV